MIYPGAGHQPRNRARPVPPHGPKRLRHLAPSRRLRRERMRMANGGWRMESLDPWRLLQERGRLDRLRRRPANGILGSWQGFSHRSVNLLSNISGLSLILLFFCLLPPGMQVSVGSLGGSQPQSVHIVQTDFLSPIPTVHHLVDGSRKANSQLARHRLFFSHRSPNGREKMNRSLGDPFCGGKAPSAARGGICQRHPGPQCTLIETRDEPVNQLLIDEWGGKAQSAFMADDATYFKLNCPACQQRIEAPRQLLNQALHCPTCNYLIATATEEQRPISNSPYQLPEITDEAFRSIQVRSSDGQKFYSVSLVDYTCTCPEFLENHQSAPKLDFGRLCKHLCAALNNPKFFPYLGPMCQAIVAERFSVTPGRFDVDKNGNPIYITGTKNNGWLNVFALKRKKGKTYYRFGYNALEQRWAYGVRAPVDDSKLPKLSEFDLPSPYQQNSVRPGKLPKSFALSALKLLAGVATWIFALLATVIFGLILGGLKSGTKSRRRKW